MESASELLTPVNVANVRTFGRARDDCRHIVHVVGSAERQPARVEVSLAFYDLADFDRGMQQARQHFSATPQIWYRLRLRSILPGERREDHLHDQWKELFE